MGSVMRGALLRCGKAGYGARIAVLNLALAASCIGTEAAAEPVTVAALGDSLTQGYGLPEGDGFVPQLQRWLDENGVDATVLNAGVSGDTTAGGLARIDWTLTPEVGALIVALGGNDLLRGLPPDEARANLSGILDKARDRGLPVLLIGLPAPGNYGGDYKSAFDAIWPDLSGEYGSLLVPDFLAPLRTATGNGAAPADLMQADGLHPSAKGVALMVEAVGPKVAELVGKVR
jgi:acyl-CoA thioesterase-1